VSLLYRYALAQLQDAPSGPNTWLLQPGAWYFRDGGQHQVP
jgi:hypothetical protein